MIHCLVNSTILLAGIFGNLIGGKLIDAIGIRHFYQSISFFVFWGTLLYVLSFKLKVKKEKKGENINVAR
jgi:predicted MFS family arabinose efflux permease